MGAIAAAMAPADASDGTALKMENDRLKQEIARKDQHIEALKGLINVQVCHLLAMSSVQPEQIMTDFIFSSWCFAGLTFSSEPCVCSGSSNGCTICCSLVDSQPASVCMFAVCSRC